MSKSAVTARVARHVAVLTLGWLLLVAGLAALFLPGPGMLMVFGGMAILARHHKWARSLLRPIKIKAMLGAAEAVEKPWRTVGSAIGALLVGAFGVLWLVQPDVPAWWPVVDDWWLKGGRTVGVTLCLSGVIALLLLVFSVRRFHGHPERIDELRRMARARKRAVEKVRAMRRERRHPGAG